MVGLCLLLQPIKIVCFWLFDRFERQTSRQTVTTVRDWRCFLARGEDVIGVMKVVSVTRMII